MKHQKPLYSIVLISSISASGYTQASLFDRGNGLIYDDVLNITWTKNANLFQTQAANNENIVNEIIAANGGFVNDSVDLVYDPNKGSFYNPNNGLYSLKVSDFDAASGQMNRWGAQAWIEYINNIRYGGYTNWRLPSISPVNGSSFNYNFSDNGSTDLSYNLISPHSELAYLYNVELLNTSFVLPNSGYNNTNPAWNGTVNAIFQDAANDYAVDSFTNLESYAYAVGDKYDPNLSYQWIFSTKYGSQGFSNKSSFLYAWAVRDGDVATIPVPSAVWLFGIGLIGLVSLVRKQETYS